MLQPGLDHLVFNNRFTQELAADTETANTRRQVHSAMFSRVAPTPVSDPTLVAWSREMADELGLSEQDVQTRQFTEVFSGNALLDGMDPYAMCYGGHQFGHWAGQLGDGRAINLGEVVSTNNELLALQLKGAGPTPYSRSADGLAVLRSSVREFLCSEAMFHLGIPTTRALSLTLTGEQVMRDMFYDGNAQLEPGAVVCRVASSFLRLGNFEIFASRNDVDNLKRLTDFTLQHYFPELGNPGKDSYIAFFQEVCRRTARLIAEWQRVGFVHGVMNTDNLSVLGLTIDYGPYGWLENFDPGWTPNTTDAQGRRYCFGNQPKIGQWNLVQFANALYPLIEDAKPLEDALHEYVRDFESAWYGIMSNKLGLSSLNASADATFVEAHFDLLESRETDMTIFYRSLADFSASSERVEFSDAKTILQPAFYDEAPADEKYRAKATAWFSDYAARLEKDPLSRNDRVLTMNATNPLYVLRNYLAQLCIDKAEEGDFSPISEQLDVLRKPYEVQPGKEKFAEKRPEWARHRAGCSMLSCSS